MSSRTWTRGALSPERRLYDGECWRVVESQFHASTMKLVDSLEEQTRLEALLETVKPLVPAPCRHLHYLLSTPFRYEAPYPAGSRFRRAGLTPGVFYASEDARTAITELAFHRLLFFADSPSTPWPRAAGGYTAFSARVRGQGIDLTKPPLDRDRARWTHPTDYAQTQALADAAREAGAALLRYASARDTSGVNIAVLTCTAFSADTPLARQSWHLYFSAAGVRAICDFPESRLSFDREAFGRDPRVRGLTWDRQGQAS